MPEGVNIRAVLMALLVGVLLSVFLGVITYPIIELGPWDAEEFLAMSASPWVLAFSMVLSLAITAICGCVAALRTPDRELMHAGFTGIGVLLLWAALQFVPAPAALPSTPLWVNALTAMLTLPAALAGGWFAQGRARRLRELFPEPPCT